MQQSPVPTAPHVEHCESARLTHTTSQATSQHSGRSSHTVWQQAASEQ